MSFTEWLVQGSGTRLSGAEKGLTPNLLFYCPSSPWASCFPSEKWDREVLSSVGGGGTCGGRAERQAEREPTCAGDAEPPPQAAKSAADAAPRVTGQAQELLGAEAGTVQVQ